jgi:hypothetical protein
MSDQASDRSAARMVRAEDLTQEDPQRHQRRIDPVEPNDARRCQRLRYDAFRQHIREWQIAVLQKLSPKKTRLLLKPSVVVGSHLGPPCRRWVCDNTI